MNPARSHLNLTTVLQGLLFLCVTILSASCSSDEASDGYVMRFKANGIQQEFVTGVGQTATFTLDDNQHIGLIVGSDGTRTMALKVYDTEEITVAVYRQFEPKDDGFTGSLIAYQDESGTEYTQGAVVPDIRVRITEITSTSVSGTFGGTLKAEGKPDLPITEGEFFVRRLE